MVRTTIRPGHYNRLHNSRSPVAAARRAYPKKKKKKEKTPPPPSPSPSPDPSESESESESGSSVHEIPNPNPPVPPIINDISSGEESQSNSQTSGEEEVGPSSNNNSAAQQVNKGVAVDSCKSQSVPPSELAVAYPLITTRHYVTFGFMGPHMEEESLLRPDQLPDPLPPPDWHGYTVEQQRHLLIVVGTLKDIVSKAKCTLASRGHSAFSHLPTDKHTGVYKEIAAGSGKIQSATPPEYPLITTRHYVPFGIFGPHTEEESLLDPDLLLDPLPPPNWRGYTVEEQRDLLVVAGTLKQFVTNAKCMLAGYDHNTSYHSSADTQHQSAFHDPNRDPGPMTSPTPQPNGGSTGIF